MSEARNRVDVRASRGVIVGDGARVFQLFLNAPEALSRQIPLRQFERIIDDVRGSFVGRRFVFDAIDRLISERSSGYIVVRGEPGIGKTALCAKLVAERGYLHHFNVAAENIRSARQFLDSICAQLIVSYGLEYDALPPDSGSNSALLADLLTEVAARARAKGGGHVVVIVDALDEAEPAAAAGDRANRLLLPRILPAGVFFIVTSRDDADPGLDVDEIAEIWVRDDDPANRADIREFITNYIDARSDLLTARISEWGLSRADFIEVLLGRSEGNFMYLRHVLPAISSGALSRETIGEIDALPIGLRGYYSSHWRQMRAADRDQFEHVQRPLLCLLAVAREPVTVAQLSEWSGVANGDARVALEEWRAFLNVSFDSDGPRYRLYHRSFAEFLDETVDLRAHHALIAQAALRKLPSLSVER